MLLDPNTLVQGRHRRPGRHCRSATTASTSPTASPRPAATGRPGRCATWRPAKALADELKWIKFSGAAWTPDGKGFFYSRYDEPKNGAEFQAPDLQPEGLLPPPRHAAGRRRAGLQAARPPRLGLLGRRQRGRPLPGHHDLARAPTPQYRVTYRDLAEPLAMPVDLIDDFENEYTFVGNDGPVFYFKTDFERPARPAHRHRHCASPTARTGRRSSREAKESLHGVTLVGNLFVADYLKDAQVAGEAVRAGRHVRPRGGAARHRHRRPASAASAPTPRRFTPSPASTRRRASTATTCMTGKSTLFRQAKVKFNPDDYEVKQVFYPSKDGTKVPMFVTAQEGPEARRHATRRCCTATAASTSR